MSEVKYGHIVSADDITKVNQMIRKYVKVARSIDYLNKLVKQSQYLYILTFSPEWSNIKNLQAVRKRAKNEWHTTEKMATTRAEKINRGLL